ncbi:hypothetical protein F2P81_023929 [Scophthalmus maximus]|uniref:Uncharacterized protein n=1 Tax=Scophthalmus maximus TaxID=52904 RepID=A0A6A4RSN2_SCOMX|nr:hypothetical protein F2P81_023929 [Scophthalmus maximus]
MSSVTHCLYVRLFVNQQLKRHYQRYGVCPPFFTSLLDPYGGRNNICQCQETLDEPRCTRGRHNLDVANAEIRNTSKSADEPVSDIY